MGRTKLVVVVAVVGVLAGVVGGVAGAGLGPSFTDVGPTHPFAADIERIVDAGITTGYPDGTYRPGANVSRGAMAAFMSRGFSSVAYDRIGSVGLPNGTLQATVATVEVASPAPSSAAGAGGHLLLTASVDVSVLGACPCGMTLFIEREGEGPLGPDRFFTLPATGGTSSYTPATLSVALPFAAGDVDTFRAVVQKRDSTTVPMGAIGELSVVYVPFGSTSEAPPGVASASASNGR